MGVGGDIRPFSIFKLGEQKFIFLKIHNRYNSFPLHIDRYSLQLHAVALGNGLRAQLNTSYFEGLIYFFVLQCNDCGSILFLMYQLMTFSPQ